jgi:putative FmdB family regulatory protein
MPTYEYVCPKCDHAFEQFQSMNDAPLKKCIKCKKPGVKRLIGGGAGLIFKGTGFYITDYKNKKQPAEKSKGGEKAAPAKVEAKSESKSESKPAKVAASTT